MQTIIAQLNTVTPRLETYFTEDANAKKKTPMLCKRTYEVVIMVGGSNTPSVLKGAIEDCCSSAPLWQSSCTAFKNVYVKLNIHILE